METSPKPSPGQARPQRLWYAELFGNVRIDYGPHTVSFRSKAAAHLVAYLLAHPRHEEHREKIQALFWPDEPQDDAANVFRVTLSRLRTGLTAFSDNFPVEITPTTLRVDPKAFFCDLLEFDRHLVLARQEEDHRARIQHLSKAVGFYRDTLLRDCDYLWVHQVRLERENKYLAALRELFHDAEARGRKADAVDYAQRILNEDPYDTQLDEWVAQQRRIPVRLPATTGAPVPVDHGIMAADDEAENELDSLEALEDWLESSQDETLAITLPRFDFHLAYARTVCRVLGFAKSQAVRNTGRVPVSWNVDLTCHTVTFRLKTTGNIIILRPEPDDPSFAESGLHSPFFIDPTAAKLTNDTLNREYANFKQAVKAVLGVFPGTMDRVIVKEFVKASRGQLTLLLHCLSRENSSARVNQKTAAAFRELVGESQRRWQRSLSAETGGSEALELADRWREVNSFLTPEVGDFLFETPFEPVERLLMPVVQVRNFDGRKHVRIPETPANPPANMAHLANLAMKAFFRAASTAEQISDDTLRFVSEAAEYYDGKTDGIRLDREHVGRLASHMSRLIGSAQSTKAAAYLADAIIEAVNLDECDDRLLLFFCVAAISTDPRGKTISRIIEHLKLCQPDGLAIAIIAKEVTNAKCHCTAPPDFQELAEEFAAIRYRPYIAVFSYNLAVSHCFYGDIPNALKFMRLAEEHEDTIDNVTAVAGLFIKAKSYDVKQEHHAAAELYRACVQALTPLRDARQLSYLTYQEDRSLIRLNEGNYARIRKNLMESIELGHENLIIGHLINAILTTENGGSRSVLIGKLQQFNSELPLHVLRQFRDDIEDILDFSAEDQDIDLALVRQGSRMSNNEFARFVSCLA